MTKFEMFNLIATVNADNKEIVDFCKHEIELLQKKRGASSGKPTPKQRENEVIKDKILEQMVLADKPLRAGEIAEAMTLTTSKVTSLLTQMVKADKVDRHLEKKVAYYSVKVEATEDEVEAE